MHKDPDDRRFTIKKSALRGVFRGHVFRLQKADIVTQRSRLPFPEGAAILLDLTIVPARVFAKDVLELLIERDIQSLPKTELPILVVTRKGEQEFLTMYFVQGMEEMMGL